MDKIIRNKQQLFLFFSLLLFFSILVLAVNLTAAPENVQVGEGVQVKEMFFVSRVIDGDTIQLADGTRVRYIGINTPESVDKRRGLEFMGKEASKFNKQLVEGKNVRLEFDVQQKDKYGRLLAYVYRVSDNLFINAELVRQGYAQASTYPPNVKYADYFRKLENFARTQGRGLWSDSKLAKNEDYYIASKNSQVFHRPGCNLAKNIASYNIVRYNSREEAINAGKRACSGCKP